MKLLQLLPSILFLSILIITANTSCTTDNEEDLMPDNGCDTLNVTYSTVAVLMTDNCVSCHNVDFTYKEGIVLDSYDDLKASVNTNLFWGSINHEEGFAAMPSGAPKMDDCDIAKIGAWINAGMP